MKGEGELEEYPSDSSDLKKNTAAYASLSSICTLIQGIVYSVYVIPHLLGSNTFAPKLACISSIS